MEESEDKLGTNLGMVKKKVLRYIHKGGKDFNFVLPVLFWWSICMGVFHESLYQTAMETELE